MRPRSTEAARNPARFAPVFVLAPARSFTSVIGTMVGQHPALFALPELKLFACPTLGELAASLPEYWRRRGVVHRSPGLVRAVAELLCAGQNTVGIAAAQAWLAARADWPGEAVFDALLERLAPRQAVEKSPETVETDAALARAVAAYPRARFLHLVRHPVATQRSIAAHCERLLPGRGGEGQPMAGIAAWYVTHRRILDLAETLPAGPYLLLRAEDVLNDPGARLAAIAAWLGLATDKAVVAAMRRPWQSPFAGLAPPRLGPLGGNDPAFLADPRPRAVAVPEGLAPPPGWTEGEGVWAEVADLARALGYG